MDLYDNVNDVIKIGTGSKDKTVRVFSLLNDSISMPIYQSMDHTAMVTSLQFCRKGTSLLASASYDGSVIFHDYRGTKVNIIEHAHHRPHSAIWHPCLNNVLLTAGLDHIIYQWDIRSLKTPVLSYVGHHDATIPVKTIHRPVFWNNEYILSGGEGTYSISMFESVNNKLHNNSNSVYHHPINSHTLEKDVGCLAALEDTVAVSVENGDICLFTPSTRHTEGA